jgi:hypothetical protein
MTTDSPPIQLTPVEVPDNGTQDGGPRIEAIVGGAALFILLAYVGLYWRGLAGAERYARGFVAETCPVCGRGEMVIEARNDRLFGIPRVRRTVHCTVCRSVLRETGARRWRYAVDPIENAALYERYNGREIDDDTLKVLANQPVNPAEPPTTRPPASPPAFVDDEDA